MSSLKVVIIQKDGTDKSLTIKKFNLDDLYVKCGFKNNNHFQLFNKKFIMNDDNYELFIGGKTKGNEKFINQFNFPPPVDNTLFFGNCILFLKKKDDYTHLTLDFWKLVYEHLFGGFENINQLEQIIDDDDESDELNKISNDKKSNGYLKDGFVVSSSSDDSESEWESELSEEDYIDTL
jgi:hypothetical protein